MRSIIIISLLTVGCTNDVPPDNAPEPTEGASTPAEDRGSTGAADAGSDGAGQNGSPAPAAPVDEDGDGFTAEEDCNDQDALIHPHAVEVCDGIDNDCDGLIDPPEADDASLWFRDSDGDGYGGTTSRTACDAPGDHWTVTGLDCNDSDAEIHPDAVEVCDGVDSDCDGAEGEGLAAWFPGGGSEAEDVTELMDSGIFHRLEHGTLRLCEGTFSTQFEFELSGLSASISSKVTVEGIGRVSIDGRGDGRLFEVGDGVSTLELMNLRLMNGEADSGGAIHAQSLDLVLEDVSFTDNHAAGPGGAVYIEDGSIEMDEVEFFRNTSNGFGAHGAAIYMISGDVTGVDVTIQGNEATGMSSGGGILLLDGRVDLEEASITNNSAGYKGGAIVNFGGDVSLVDSVVEGNSALMGGGVYVAGDLDLVGTRLEDNSANTGGAVYLEDRDGWQTVSCQGGGSFLDNGGGIKGAAMFVENPFGTTVDSDSCDWGTGSSDNGSGVDIDTPMSAISAANDATFTCVNYTCSGDVSVAYGAE